MNPLWFVEQNMVGDPESSLHQMLHLREMILKTIPFCRVGA
jgi:hypothetical protein